MDTTWWTAVMVALGLMGVSAAFGYGCRCAWTHRRGLRTGYRNGHADAMKDLKDLIKARRK